MNNYEKTLLSAFCIFVIGLIVLNVLKLGLWACPIFLISDSIYQTMFSILRLKTREEFKDKIACWTNRLSIVFMTIGTVNLVISKI